MDDDDDDDDDDDGLVTVRIDCQADIAHACNFVFIICMMCFY